MRCGGSACRVGPMSQPPLILIAHATKKGSTHEVAEAIRDVLTGYGLRVDVVAARDVSSLDGYAGVVLGGALYFGRWHAAAGSFLRRLSDELSDLPLAVFAMGPTTLDDEQVAGARAQLEAALEKAPVTPDFVAIFGGVVDPTKFRFPLNRMPATDARDWDAIHGFADQAASLFKYDAAVVPA